MCSVYRYTQVSTYSPSGDWHPGLVLVNRVQHAQLDSKLTFRVGDDRITKILEIFVSLHIGEISSNYMYM